jgi:hypothetical protein
MSVSALDSGVSNLTKVLFQAGRQALSIDNRRHGEVANFLSYTLDGSLLDAFTLL